MSDNSNNAGGGAGFTSLLLVAFIVLKLCNVIHWSWWWVLSPAWIPAGLILIGGLIYIWTEVVKGRKKRKSFKADKSKWEMRLEEMREKNKAS